MIKRYNSFLNENVNLTTYYKTMETSVMPYILDIIKNEDIKLNQDLINKFCFNRIMFNMINHNINNKLKNMDSGNFNDNQLKNYVMFKKLSDEYLKNFDLRSIDPYYLKQLDQYKTKIFNVDFCKELFDRFLKNNNQGDIAERSFVTFVHEFMPAVKIEHANLTDDKIGVDFEVSIGNSRSTIQVKSTMNDVINSGKAVSFSNHKLYNNGTLSFQSSIDPKIKSDVILAIISREKIYIIQNFNISVNMQGRLKMIKINYEKCKEYNFKTNF